MAQALADVLALEAREVELYRQASKGVADLVGPVERAQAWYRQAQRDVEVLRMRNAQEGVDSAHYRETYREMRVARREAEQVRLVQRPARELLDRRRQEAVAALSAAGVGERDAEAMLDGVDIDTGLAPPFM